MTPNMRIALIVIGLAMLCAYGVSHAQVTSTRTTAYDWQCQDSAGVRISDHARFDTAFVACLNATNGAFVQGGRYRITKTVTPTPPATTGSATLSWVPPSQNTDGSAAVISAYRIHYGNKPDEMTQVVQIAPATTYTLTGLVPGTYFFAVRAVTANAESALSSTVSKTL